MNWTLKQEEGEPPVLQHTTVDGWQRNVTKGSGKFEGKYVLFGATEELMPASEVADCPVYILGFDDIFEALIAGQQRKLPIKI